MARRSKSRRRNRRTQSRPRSLMSMVVSRQHMVGKRPMSIGDRI